MEPATATAVTEGAKATRKFMNVLQNFFKPRQTKKQVDADIYVIDKIKEAEKEYPDLDFTYEDGRIKTRKLTYEEILERWNRRKLIESLKQEQNLERVMTLAANEVKNTNETVSDESVDEDWLTRFFHIAEDVSSDDMQLVWSKILAGEIIQPGKFSLRTLETIRNVSKPEADIFQRMLPLLMKSTREYFIVSDSEILKKYGLSYKNLLRLSECGLLNISSTTRMWHLITNKRPGIIYNDKKTIAILGIDSAEIRVSYGVYVLTKVGTELYSILEHKYSNEYMRDLVQYVQDSNKGKCIINVAENY